MNTTSDIQATESPPITIENPLQLESVGFDPIPREIMVELTEMDPEEVRINNVNASTTHATLLGHLPGIMSLRSDIIKNAPSFDIKWIDKLPLYLEAYRQYTARCSAITINPDNLPEIARQAEDVRTVLHADVRLLVARGLISQDSLRDVHGFSGYLNTASDIDILTAVEQSNWDKIHLVSTMTPEELHHATTLANELRSTLEQRDNQPNQRADTLDLRNRAFTLVMRAYDQVRRVVLFLRWEQGDADDIAPSVYNATRRRRTTADDQEETDTSSAPEDLATANTPHSAQPAKPLSPNAPNDNPFLE